MRDLDDRLRAEQARLGELPDASDRRRQLGRLFDQHLQRLLLLMQALATEGGRVVCGAAMQRAQEAMVRAVEPRLQVNMLLRDAARRIAIDGADERIWTMLDRLIAAGRIRDERLRRTPDGATYRFAHEGGERIWIIESINVGGDGLVRIRRGDRPEIFVGVEPGTFFEMAAAGRIGDLCRQAVSNHERQRQPERLALRAYDFPVERLRRTGGKIAHIRLFSADREVMGSVITSMIQASALRGAALRARYGEDMVLLPPPAIDRDPIQALRRALRGAYDLGARHFPVDVFSHGTSEYLDMGRRVTGAQLLEVLRELPNDASFDLSTIACFGGGLRVSLMRALARPENASIRGRLNVFLEAKPYVGNILMTVGGDALERERNGTHQYYLVTRSLFAGRSYGQAHEYADDMTPDFLPMDPEVILRGVLLTRRDATPDAHLA